MARAQSIILVMTLALILMGLSAMVASVIGEVWYTKLKPYTTIGLRTLCTLNRNNEVSCVNRKLFQFKDYIGLDLILTGLIASSTMSLFSSIFTICLFSFTQNMSVRRCNLYINSVCTFLAAAVALASVSYSEYWARNVFKQQPFRHGWSGLLAWAGAGEVFLGSVFAYILTCVYPNNAVNGARHIQGYEMR